ncbi:MAG TPA: amidohydrolase family protein [Opitutaceae bacterium]
MSPEFVDSHMHFWDLGRFRYSWLDEHPSIAGRHTPENIDAEAGPLAPSQIVFVECGAPWLEEVRWIESLAAREPRIAAIVAHCPMNTGAGTEAAIAGLRRHPLVRGVRHNIQDETDPRYCASDAFVAGVRMLAGTGLSFDICCKHGQLPAVVELVRRCPDTRFVLDHFGKPAIAIGQLDPWRADIAVLAALPNIVCKLSGIITEADHARWTIDDLRPFVDHVLATFGPGRLLFGGDWPVAKLAGSYTRWLETARLLVSHLPPGDQAAIFSTNARRAYRLD